MPIYEYVLLAMLASGSHGQQDITLTLGPDVIVQPKGGGLLLLAKDVGRNTSIKSTSGIKGESQGDQHKVRTELQSNPYKLTPNAAKKKKK